MATSSTRTRTWASTSSSTRAHTRTRSRKRASASRTIRVPSRWASSPARPSSDIGGVGGMTRQPLYALAQVFVRILVGCQAGAPGGFLQQATLPPVPSDVGVGPRCPLVLAPPVGLLGASADGKIIGRIDELPAGTTPSCVAVHPDGNTIYFALVQSSAASAQGVGFGSDIYSVRVDGTDL